MDDRVKLRMTPARRRALEDVKEGLVRPIGFKNYTIARLDVLEVLCAAGLIVFMRGYRPTITEAGRRALGGERP